MWRPWKLWAIIAVMAMFGYVLSAAPVNYLAGRTRTRAYTLPITMVIYQPLSRIEVLETIYYHEFNLLVEVFGPPDPYRPPPPQIPASP